MMFARERRKNRGRFLVMVVIIIAIMASSGAALVSADQPERNCSNGDVTAALQALNVGFITVNDFGSDVKQAGLGGGVANCWYRLAGGGPTNTFSASDHILGAIGWLAPYKDEGVHREEAIADISTITDRVFLGPAGGPLVEQDLTYTAFKNVQIPGLGTSVYQIRGFTTQLEPGEYDSRWELYFDDVFVFSTIVRLVVEP